MTTGGVSAKVRASSVARAIRVIGDRWAFLVLRDALQGAHRFEQFVERTGASRSTLTRRLDVLVDSGILRRVQYSHAPARWEYRLTPQGLDLFPLNVWAWAWEQRWAPRGARMPPRLRHDCERPLQAETACSSCGEILRLRDVEYERRPGVAARLLPRAARSRRLSGLTAATHRGNQDTLTHVADLVGDPWTPLVLAASFFGVRRYDDFQRELGIATNILAARLELLVGQHVFRREQYQELPARFEYRLTDKGRDLFPYALLLNAWGDRWLARRVGSPFRFIHRACGREFHAIVRCGHCRKPVTPASLSRSPRGRRTLAA